MPQVDLGCGAGTAVWFQRDLYLIGLNLSFDLVLLASWRLLFTEECMS